MERSEKYVELMERFEVARKRYVNIVKGAEASHMMLEQYADIEELTAIKDALDGILREAKDRLSDYDEYIEVTSAAITLQNAVESARCLARYVSCK